MTDKAVMEGGCLCGAIRFSIAGPPFMTEYCHCSMCRRSTGGPVACWMDFRSEQLTWVRGEPKEYHSSEHARRGFCESCGSSISFRDTRYPQYATLTIVSLDNPALAPPKRHIYVEDQLPWFVVKDDCVRFPRGPQKAGS